MKNTKTRALAEGAICVALSLVLSLVEPSLPQGGGFGLTMLPIFLFCSRWGWKHGFLAAFACGVLQMIFDGAYAWGPWSFILDYLLAYGVLGVAGFFRKKKGGIFIGTVVGCVCRFVFHFLSGVTIYRIYEPVELFSTTWTNPWLYSAVYNGSFILLDMVLCLVVFAALYKPLRKYMTPAALGH